MFDCMVVLRKSGPGEAVTDGLESKPFFGICVGAQLLFEYSERGDTTGLGCFKGRVKRFLPNQADVQGNRSKVPHMGWSTVCQTRPHSLSKDTAPNSRSYFVHNYYFASEDPDVVPGTSEYPYEFAYTVGKDNVFVTQLHAEKSYDASLLLLHNSLGWNDG